MEKQSCSKPRQMARRSAWKNWRNIRGDSKVAGGRWLVASGVLQSQKKKARVGSPRFAFHPCRLAVAALCDLRRVLVLVVVAHPGHRMRLDALLVAAFWDHVEE